MIKRCKAINNEKVQFNICNKITVDSELCAPHYVGGCGDYSAIKEKSLLNFNNMAFSNVLL